MFRSLFLHVKNMNESFIGEDIFHQTPIEELALLQIFFCSLERPTRPGFRACRKHMRSAGPRLLDSTFAAMKMSSGERNVLIRIKGTEDN